MRYVTLLAAFLSGLLMCNPCSAQGWRGSRAWSRFFTPSKPALPRDPGPSFRPQVGNAAGRLVWHLQRLQGQEREDYRFTGPDPPFGDSLGSSKRAEIAPALTGYFDPQHSIDFWASGATGVGRERSAELCQQIDQAVTNHLNFVRAAYGEAAWEHERIRTAAVVNQAKLAVWSGGRSPTSAWTGFPLRSTGHDVVWAVPEEFPPRFGAARGLGDSVYSRSARGTIPLIGSWPVGPK